MREPPLRALRGGGSRVLRMYFRAYPKGAYGHVVTRESEVNGGSTAWI